MRIGLIGRPASGKTSVFRILTGYAGPAPLHTREPEVGVYPLPDARLEPIARWAGCDRRTPATLELWDPPSHWSLEDGTAPRLIGELRTMDALLHVLAVWDLDVLDPGEAVRRADDLERTLITADLQVLEGRYQRLQQEYAKRHQEELLKESQYVSAMLKCLQGERPLRAEPWPQDIVQRTQGYGLLSIKPIFHLLNVAERHLGDAAVAAVLPRIAERFPWAGTAYTSAHLELELIQMDPAERAEWQAIYGLPDLLPDRIAEPLLGALGLLRFYTVVGGEARAWLLPVGATASQAAGRIHTDMERGFIRAEVLNFREIGTVGSFQEARRQGRLRLEGRDYVVQDGDILTVKFAV
jgi:ribosome-binding ATPase YchF (GTP1/OBG family)